MERRGPSSTSLKDAEVFKFRQESSRLCTGAVPLGDSEPFSFWGVVHIVCYCCFVGLRNVNEKRSAIGDAIVETDRRFQTASTNNNDNQFIALFEKLTDGRKNDSKVFLVAMQCL